VFFWTFVQSSLAPLFSFAVVAQDYVPSDTFVSIAASLKNLMRVTDDVFGRIEEQVSHSRERLQSLNNRVALIRDRITRIGQSTKAVTIHSATKYPAVEGSGACSLCTIKRRWSLEASRCPRDSQSHATQTMCASTLVARFLCLILLRKTIRSQRPEARKSSLLRLSVASIRWPPTTWSLLATTNVPLFLSFRRSRVDARRGLVAVETGAAAAA
jgi:hypothetical protein